MRNKWIRKVLSLCVTLVILMAFGAPIPALAAPVTTISLSGTPGDGPWFLSDVTVTLEATDNISGVARIEYRLDYPDPWITYTSPFIISEEGYYHVAARAWDNEGHVEDPWPTVLVTIDKTPPVTTITVNGEPIGIDDWRPGDPTVMLTADDNVSTTGATPIQYSLDGGNNWLDYDGVPFFISNEGITTILAKVRNNAGIQEDPPVSATVKLDKTAPAATMTVIPTEISSKKSGRMFDICYTGTALDSVSGIYLVNTELIDEYGVYSQNLGASLSGTVSVERHCNDDDADGRTYTFRLTVTDMAGNQATIDAVTTVTRN